MTDTPSALGAALATTRAAGPTRFTMRLEREGSRARLDELRPRGPMQRLGRFLGRRATGTVEVDGVLDIDGHRVMASTGGAWGMVQIGDRAWSGRPGRPVDDDAAEPAPLTIDPLGLIGSIDRLRDVGDRGPDAADHRFVAPTDTGTVEVHLRNERVHLIRRDDDGDVTTVTLHETPVDTRTLDWSRLPGDDAATGA